MSLFFVLDMDSPTSGGFVLEEISHGCQHEGTNILKGSEYNLTIKFVMLYLSLYILFTLQVPYN